MDPVPPFTAFGTGHLVTLALIAAAIVLVPWLALRLDGRRRRQLALAIAAAMAFNEASKILIGVYVYDLPLSVNLPLHLCGVTSLMTIWVLWRRSYGVYEIAWFWGMGGTIPTLLTPDLDVGFPSYFYVRFFGGHALIVLGLVYATVVYGYRPTLRSVGKAIVATLTLAMLLVPVNLLLDTNYMYLSAKPDAATIMDYMGPWPWYIPAMCMVMVGVCFLWYLPFVFLRERAVRDVERVQA